VSLIFRVFLGLVGYYRKFIKGFSKPMIELLGRTRSSSGRHL
jgi:hypothetical protein